MEPPIVCSLDADDASERIEEWRRFFARSVDGLRQLSGNRFRFHLGGDPADLSEAADLARREKACCPFFDFSIQIESDSYWLVVSVPPEAAAVLDDFVRLASPASRMKLDRKVIDELRVAPGSPADLKGRSTRETKAPWTGKASSANENEIARKDLTDFRDELESAQQLLYATRSYSVLVIFQGLDAAGKDGTIKHVMSGVNPQGCGVYSFKEPTPEELAHDFLWRCEQVLPERGHIAIFNRSYYEDVLVVRVHPELLTPEHLPPRSASGDALWNARHEDINAFERHLDRSGTRVLKFFLHVSKEVQKKRILARLVDPTKYWKFSPSDLAERAYFGEYQRVYEDVVTATSTKWAPWYVVPADHKPAMRAMVGGVLAHTIDDLSLRMPEPDEATRKQMDEARRGLRAE